MRSTLFINVYEYSIVLLTLSKCCKLPGGSDSKDSACNTGDPGLISGLGRSPGEGTSNPQ